MAQAIPILLTPVLTHLYTPEDFGVFQLYFSIIGFLAVISCGRYELAIMLPKEDKDALNLVGVCFRITVLLALVVTLVVFFFQQQITELFETPEIGPYLWLLPVSTLFLGMYQALNYWTNRKSQYKRLASSRVARATVSTGGSIGLYYTVFRKGGLILGDVIGQALATLWLFFQNFRFGAALKDINKNGRKQVMRRYRQFPIFNLVGAVLEKSAGSLPVWLFFPYFGPEIVGLYALSQRVVAAPGSIIARAFGDVFRQQAAARWMEKGECKDLFTVTLKRLSLLSVVPFVIFFFIAPWAFGLVFGDEWIVGGEYAKIMTPMFMLQFIVNPLANMFLVAEKQKYELYLQTLLFAGVLGGVLIGKFIYDDVKVALYILTAVYCAKYLTELLMSYRFSKGNTVKPV